METIQIRTTQNVTIEYELASVGLRIGAFFIDRVLLYGVFFLALWQLLGFTFDGTIEWDMLTVILILFAITPLLLYDLLFETFYDGQTLGKKLMRIRVARVDGKRPSFYNYLVRWLFSFFDKNLVVFAAISSGGMYQQLFGGGLAIVFIVSTKRGQRLGDIAAGTCVIDMRRRVEYSQDILPDFEDDYVAVYPQVTRLNDRDARIVRQILESQGLQPNSEALAKVVRKVEEVTGIDSKGAEHRKFLATVLKDYQHLTSDVPGQQD